MHAARVFCLAKCRMRFRDVRTVGLAASFRVLFGSARVRVLFAQHCSGTRSERRRLRARERAVPGACRGEPSPPRARERSPPYASERSPSRARAVPAQCEGHAQRCRVAERTAERKRYELSALPSAFSAPIRTRGRTRADAFSAPIRADERRARTNVSPDERGGGNAASSEVARRIRAPAVITLVELATGLAVCSPGGRSASSPEARPRVGRRLVVGQDPPIALRAGAVRPQYRQLSDASRASPRASPGVIR